MNARLILDFLKGETSSTEHNFRFGRQRWADSGTESEERERGRNTGGQWWEGIRAEEWRRQLWARSRRRRRRRSRGRRRRRWSWGGGAGQQDGQKLHETGIYYMLNSKLFLKLKRIRLLCPKYFNTRIIRWRTTCRRRAVVLITASKKQSTTTGSNENRWHVFLLIGSFYFLFSAQSL